MPSLPTRFGVTTLETWLRCPLKVLYGADRHLPRRRDPAALIGSALHATLDDLAKDKGVDVVASFERRWSSLLEGRNFRETRLVVPEDRLERARRFVWSMSTARQRGRAQTTTEVTLASSSGNVVGTIDRLRRGPSGEPSIFEVKTGAVTSDRLKTYRDQLVSYAYLLADSGGGLALRGALLFVLAGGVVRQSWTAEEVAARGALLEESASDILATHAVTPQHGRVSDECNRCDYRPWCPAFWSVYQRTVRSEDANIPIAGAEILVREVVESKGQLLIVGASDRKPIDLLVTLADYPHAAALQAGALARVTDVLLSPLGRLRLRMTKGSEVFVISHRPRGAV